LERDNRSPVCREEQQKKIFDSEYLSGGGCKAKKEKKKSFAYVFGNINCNVFIVYKKGKNMKMLLQYLPTNIRLIKKIYFKRLF